MTFKSDYGEFMAQVRTKHVENVGKVEDAVYAGVVNQTPEKSGALRANHNRTVGTPSFIFNPSKTHTTNPPPPINEKNLVAYVANGAPYANRVEHGWSKRRPKGMYRVTYQAVKARFKL